ncbi:MAG: ABC transporter ATP-binding protein [Streptosporangiaceae bacterium]
MTQAVLEARDVTKAYRRHQVLRGVNLAAAPGQLVGVVGENGAGKSTLLKILAGTLAADAGQVRLAGTLGYCPQDPVLNDNLTVGQHLRYFAAARRLGSLARAGELVSMLGYERYAGQVAGQLSGGTRQKLNLTLALLHDPDVLLLDEPYQGFDWETYLRFWDLVGDLRARNKTIVIITHLVFEQDRFDLLADLADGHLTRRESSAGEDDHARR